jgi:hypothetical protein
MSVIVVIFVLIAVIMLVLAARWGFHTTRKAAGLEGAEPITKEDVMNAQKIASYASLYARDLYEEYIKNGGESAAITTAPMY